MPKKDERKSAVLKCIESLRHACECTDANNDCQSPGCEKMKRVMQHAKNCRHQADSSCAICKQLIALCCFHAKYCKQNPCSVLFCANIRKKMKEAAKLRKAAKLQESEMLRLRRAAMHGLRLGMRGPAHQTCPPAIITQAGETKNLGTIDAVKVCGSILDILECCVCLGTVKVPFKQCANGHICCSRCLGPVKGCPTCRAAVNQENPATMKKILEALPQHCQV